MSFRAALDRLGAMSVPGVTNYDIAAVPPAVTRAALPALLVLPGDADEERLFKERGRGFSAVAFSSGTRTVTVTTTHLLLVAPAITGIRTGGFVPDVVDLIDAYLLALAGDVMLGGALSEPARVTVETGKFDYCDTSYHGCAFRHTWALEVTP
jgi:hypothetical protein